jgi:hypothetical protein
MVGREGLVTIAPNVAVEAVRVCAVADCTVDSMGRCLQCGTCFCALHLHHNDHYLEDLKVPVEPDRQQQAHVAIVPIANAPPLPAHLITRRLQNMTDSDVDELLLIISDVAKTFSHNGRENKRNILFGQVISPLLHYCLTN